MAIGTSAPTCEEEQPVGVTTRSYFLVLGVVALLALGVWVLWGTDLVFSTISSPGLQ